MQAAPIQSPNADSAQIAVDSVQAGADTLSTVPDTSGGQPRLNESFSEAGDLIYTGRFGEALDLLGQNLEQELARLGPKVLGALLVLIIFYSLYRMCYSVLRRILRRSSYIQQGLETLVLQSFRLGGLAFVGVMVLQTLGVDPSALVAGIGIAGIALGFAARDTVENIISGVSILVDQPFRIGDTVIVQGTYGVISEITLRTTRLRTPKNEILVVPNQQMANEKVLNHTIAGALRIEIPFSVAYKEYPDEARKIVLALTRGDARLLEHPAPKVVVNELNNSSIDLSLWVYVPEAEHERQITYDYTERIREALRKADIEIPFPHVQLKLDEGEGRNTMPPPPIERRKL